MWSGWTPSHEERMNDLTETLAQGVRPPTNRTDRDLFERPFFLAPNIGRKEITCVPLSNHHPRYTASFARANYGSNELTQTDRPLNGIVRYSPA